MARLRMFVFFLSSLIAIPASALDLDQEIAKQEAAAATLVVSFDKKNSSETKTSTCNCEVKLIPKARKVASIR